MKIPQGLLMWPHSFLASTVQPMENITMASMTVSTVLSTVPRTALKLLGGTRQSVPEQMVAWSSQPSGTVAMVGVEGEKQEATVSAEATTV